MKYYVNDVIPDVDEPLIIWLDKTINSLDWNWHRDGNGGIFLFKNQKDGFLFLLVWG